MEVCGSDEEGLEFSDTESEFDDEDDLSDDSDMDWEQEMLAKLELKMQQSVSELLFIDICCSSHQCIYIQCLEF